MTHPSTSLNSSSNQSRIHFFDLPSCRLWCISLHVFLDVPDSDTTMWNTADLSQRISSVHQCQVRHRKASIGRLCLKLLQLCRQCIHVDLMRLEQLWTAAGHKANRPVPHLCHLCHLRLPSLPHLSALFFQVLVVMWDLWNCTEVTAKSQQTQWGCW